jgi:hypothetical protein
MAEVNDRKMTAHECSLCSPVSRRDFVKAVSLGALAGAVPFIGRTAAAAGPTQVGPTTSAAAETAVARFYKTMTPEQRKMICFEFDHPLRKRVANNWHIVKPTIDNLSSEQKALCQEIMKNLCSEDGYERFMKQMEDDDGGFENYSVAVFGEPGTDKPFEWVLSGRHDTLRADGNSVEGVAFGGPIFYGHAADGHNNEDSKHTNNVWWYQGDHANKIFKTLDDKQQTQALVAKAEPDEPKSTSLKGNKLPETGLAVAGLDGQQKAMVTQLVEKILSPFRICDVEEVRACLDSNGGVDKLRMTFFKEGDIGNDGVWDILKVEGPAFSWYFRGSPHVHTWLNVARKA